MKRNTWNTGLRITGLLIALAALSVGAWSQSAAAAGSYVYTFEQDLKPWAAGPGSLLTLDRNNNVCPLEPGTSSALVTMPILGADRFGSDVAYMGASFPANAGDGVTVDWSAKTQGNCGGSCNPIVSVGGSAGGKLPWAGVKGTAGAYGWTNYHYTAAVSQPSVEAADQVYIALGVSASGPLYLGTAINIDCVRISIIPNN